MSNNTYNVICLVVDSLSYDKVINHPLGNDLFLNQCINQYGCPKQLFSQAPYTEAAVMGLQCGQRTLDYNGYFRRLYDTPKTIFEAFSENGFKTFNNTIQPHMYAKSLIRGVTDPFYNNSIDIKCLYLYRINFYRSLYETKKITQKHFDDLKKMIDDYFSFLFDYYSQLIQDYPQVELIKKNMVGFDFIKILDDIKKEFSIYCENKKNYLIEMLDKGYEHSLFKIHYCYQNDKVRNDEFRISFLKETKKLKKELNKQYFATNIKNNKTKSGILKKSFMNFMLHPSKSNLILFGKDLYSNHFRFHCQDNNKRFGKEYDFFKNAPSLPSHLEHLSKWISSTNDNFFAYVHFDDIHSSSSFLTYDSLDIDLIKNETNDCFNYFKCLSKNKAGNLCYDLGIMYVDKKIKDFVKKISSMEQGKNTIVVVTADHGYSNYYFPYRGFPANTFFKEHYHIPFIFAYVPNGYDKFFSRDCIESRHYSYSIPNTLLEIAGLNECDLFYGKSLFNDQKHMYSLFEYMGGGCPDIESKKIQYAYKDDCIGISVSSYLFGNIDLKDVYEVYDYSNDFKEEHNLISRLRKNKLSSGLMERVLNALNVVKERHFELKNSHSCYK